MKSRTIFSRRIWTAIPLLLLLAAGVASAQQIPPDALERMTPAQRAELLRRLQQSGATLPVAQTGEVQLPAVVEPQAGQQLPTVSLPEQPPVEQPFQETPYDFGIGPGGQDDLEDLELFGRSIFRMEAAAFEPVTFGPVGPDYQLGPGDQVIISMWGTYQDIYDLTINREGYVLVPKVGQVVLTHLTVEQAKRRLLQQMTPFYQALDYGNPEASAFLDITLGKLRVIKVYVLGEAANPGAYNLSSISTAFSALYTAGGPSNNGSMRAVRVVRDDEQIAEIDLYDYLLNADQSDDVRLRDGDIVFLPSIGPRIAVQGRIQRPAIYELKGREHLLDLIRFAGNPTAAAYIARSQIVRIVPPELRDRYQDDRVTIDVNLGEVITDGADPVALFDGDVVRVFSILDLRRDFVVVEGAVWRPAQYQFINGMHLTDLIEHAEGLKEEAYLDRADIIRTNPDYTTTQLRVVLGDALSGAAGANLKLQMLDRVIIHSIHDIEPRKYVSIEGHVLTPGRFLLHEEMYLTDLLFKAGGLYDPDWRKLTYLTRADLIRVAPDSITRTVIPFDLGSILDGNDSENLLLQADDLVRIYSVYAVENRKYATISGEVKNPGRFEIEENTTVNDLIIRAGGLTTDAWMEQAEISRVYPGQSEAEKRTFLYTAPIDTSFTGRGQGFRLQEFDLVIVRRMPYWELQRNVEISGEVVFPGVYTLQTPGETLASVLKRAGGFTPFAYPDGAKLFRSFEGVGLVGIDLEEACNRPGSRANLVMMPGDSLNVPEMNNTVRVAGAVNYPHSILHVPGKSLRYYIDLAGGYSENADRAHATVVLANGAAWHPNWFLIPNPPIGPGANIFIPARPETTKDIWETIRDTTALLTSFTTVLLLIWQINK
ncbi:SLBB domain-containing protein [Gemmatimonadota bacterium]